MTMVNTAEMTGRALDWAVGYIRCLEVTGGKPILARDMMSAAIRNGMASPSTDWAQGGPIIERKKLVIGYIGELWECRYFNAGKFKNCEFGPAPLIAASSATKWTCRMSCSENLSPKTTTPPQAKSLPHQRDEA